jgi:hypothetical protein
MLHRRSIARWKPRRRDEILRRTVTQVTFRILGRLEALVDGRRVDLSSRRERALLGVLLLHVGETVSVDALIDSVWGEAEPVSARHMVHEYVSRLRGALGEASVIATRSPGYVVERDASDLDAARFAELLGTARSAVAANDLDEALKAFDEALGLWRGDALSDVTLEADARAAATRLDDERRAARSERVDVALALGRHSELIPDLELAPRPNRSTSTRSGSSCSPSTATVDRPTRSRATATVGRGSSTSSESSPRPSCAGSSRRSCGTTRRWRRLPQARRSRRTAGLPRIRHRGRRGGARRWRLRALWSSSPGC